MLAHLGLAIERDNAWPDDRNGRGLKRLLKDLLPTELEVVSDRRSPAYIAVVTPEVREEIEAQIEARRQDAERSVRLEDIARPILLAFCVRVPNDSLVYVRRARPYRYELKPPDREVAGEYLIVEPKYRRPGLRVDRLDQIPRKDRMDLADRIKEWAESHGTSIEQFFRSEQDQVAPGSIAQTALDRLLAAQSPEIASRLILPGDIAQLLARHR
jgi:hypothetical protein